MSDQARVAELESSLFVCTLALAALTDRLETFDRENAHLRVVAQQVKCPYGMRASNGACTLGYPGCACMDDVTHLMSFDPDTSETAYKRRLEQRVRGLEERVRIAASHFRSMADGFQKVREPSKAAACAGMADLMDDRL